MPINPFITTRATGVSTTRTLLKIVRAAQPISRADLARRLDVNRSTVTEIVRPLLDSDVLREGSTLNPRSSVAGNSQVGRPPIAVSMNADGKYFIGINLGVRQTQVGASTLDDKPLAHEMFETPDTPAATMNLIIEYFNRVREKIADRALTSVGVSVPGPVDEARRSMLYAPHLGWTNVALASAIENALAGQSYLVSEVARAEALSFGATDKTLSAVSRTVGDSNLKSRNANNRNVFPVPVIVENDATASAVYEARRRLGRAEDGAGDDFILLRVGTGIGVGLVISGEVFRGGAGIGTSLTGEFGHMTIVAGGKQCVCGNRGCWERYASATNAAALYNGERGASSSGIPLRYQEVVGRAEAGERRAISTLEQVGNYLGIGIANMIGGLGLTNIVISGRIVHGWQFLRDPLHEALNRSMVGKLTKIKVEAGEPTGAGLGGAIEVAIDEHIARLAP